MNPEYTGGNTAVGTGFVGFPAAPYCPHGLLEEVRELTKDWPDGRDLTLVFELVARAKTLGFKLVRS